MHIYVARPGDSPYSVARRFMTDVEALCELNQLRDPTRLTAGLGLAIPGGEAGTAGMEVAACVFPNADGESLLESLPYLSYLCPFSCAVSAAGELSAPPEKWLEAAGEQAAAVLLTVTNIAEGGVFSGDAAHALFTEETAQDAFFEALLPALAAGGYYGACLSFQYVYPYDREAYNRFLRRAADTLHDRGYFLVTAVTPSSGDGRQGMPEQAHDYAVHGQCADRVALMTYDWGYSYSKPQAVSPVNRIRPVLDYAVKQIPAGRILMGLSCGGCDWSLPWRQGLAARPLSAAAAANLAVSVGAEVRYDAQAQAPYFDYSDAAGIRHQVWYEDVRSIRARLALAREYGLAGVGIWTVNRLCRPLLAALGDACQVEKVM